MLLNSPRTSKHQQSPRLFLKVCPSKASKPRQRRTFYWRGLVVPFSYRQSKNNLLICSIYGGRGISLQDVIDLSFATTYSVNHVAMVKENTNNNYSNIYTLTSCISMYENVQLSKWKDVISMYFCIHYSCYLSHSICCRALARASARPWWPLFREWFSSRSCALELRSIACG